MHVWSGLRHVAQSRHAPLAEIAVLQFYVLRSRGRTFRRIVVEAAHEAERIVLELLDSGMPARVHTSRCDEERDAGIGELAVGEMRPEVAGAAVALADEDLQPALGGFRIAGRLSAREGVPKFVERRAAADQRLLERRQCLADVDENLFVIRG